MPSLYIAVYLARPPGPAPGGASETETAFYAAPRSGFPYDAGDDPAFFSARRYGGPITWGVCRRDIRCSIRKDDGIVFIAAQDDPRDKTVHYRFVAALRVADKMQHTAASVDPLFGRYLNLLIRPRGAGWEHHEPVAKQNHRDWLWRITCQSLGLHRNKFEAAGQSHKPGAPLTIRGHLVPLASNYVVFGTSSATLALDTPLIARFRRGQPHESWESDERSAAIRELILRDSNRHLRTSNRQQPHRHIHHRDLKDAELEGTLRRIRALTERIP